MSGDGRMYEVSLSYDFSTIIVGVHAVNEEMAHQEAVELLTDEWGDKILTYSSLVVTTNEQEDGQ